MDFAGLSGSRCVQLVKKALREAGIDPADLPFEAVQLVRLALDGADPRLAGPLDDTQSAKLAELCQKRCDRWPLQYLAGRWPFLDMELEVGPGVLIPRPDTEVLCLAAADCARRLSAEADDALANQLGGWPEAPEAAPASLSGPPRLLDLCAGTGCVGLGMARLLPQAQVTAVEKSPDAWPYLVRNTAASRVTPVQGDVMGLEKTLPEAGGSLPPIPPTSPPGRWKNFPPRWPTSRKWPCWAGTTAWNFTAISPPTTRLCWPRGAGWPLRSARPRARQWPGCCGMPVHRRCRFCPTAPDGTG